LLDPAIVHNAHCVSAAAASVLEVPAPVISSGSHYWLFNLMLSNKGSTKAFEARVKNGNSK
jgi:hypothetical protein